MITNIYNPATPEFIISNIPDKIEYFLTNVINLNEFQEKIEIYIPNDKMIVWGSNANENEIIQAKSDDYTFSFTGWSGLGAILDKDAIIIKINRKFQYPVISFALRKTFDLLNILNINELQDNEYLRNEIIYKGVRLCGGTWVKKELETEMCYIEGMYFWFKFNQSIYREFFMSNNIQDNFCYPGKVALGLEDILGHDIDRTEFIRTLTEILEGITTNNLYFDEVKDFSISHRQYIKEIYNKEI